MSNKITAFVDQVGRVIIGEHLSTKSGVMQVKEPAVVNVQVNQQNGKMSVQLLPFIFREFIKPEIRDEGAVWSFDVKTCVTSENLELDDAIKNQYKNIFSKPVAKPGELNEMEKQQATAEEPEVVKLFDDEE